MHKELLTIMNKHPNLELKFFVTTDEVTPDYYYSSQIIKSVEVSIWCEYNDKIFTDESLLAEELIYLDQCETDEYALSKASDMMKEVILVKLEA